MDPSAYYSIDSILADNQKIPAEFQLDVPGLGWLEGGTEEDLKAGTKLELPFWLCSTLALAEYDFLTLSMPAPFSPRVRNALDAAPQSVRLGQLNAWWYAFGSRMAGLLEDAGAESLLGSMRTAFKGRLPEVFDQAVHAGSTAAHAAGGAGTEFREGMDEDERALFATGVESAKQTKTWFEGGKSVGKGVGKGKGKAGGGVV